MGVAAAHGLRLLQQVDGREGVGFFLRHRLQQHLLRCLLFLFLRRFSKVQPAVLCFCGRFADYRAAADCTGNQILDGGLGGGGGGVGDGRYYRLEVRLGLRLRLGNGLCRLVRLAVKVICLSGIGADLHGVGQALHLTAGDLSLLGKRLAAGGGGGFLLALQFDINIKIPAVFLLGGFGGFRRCLTVFHRGGVDLLQLLHRLGCTLEQPDEGGAGGDHKEYKEQKDIHDQCTGLPQPAQRIDPEQNGKGTAADKGSAALIQHLNALGKGSLGWNLAENMGDTTQEQHHQYHAGAFQPGRDGGAIHGRQDCHQHHQRSDEVAAPAHQSPQHIMYGIPRARTGNGGKAQQQNAQRKEDNGVQLTLCLKLCLGWLFGSGLSFFCGRFFGSSHGEGSFSFPVIKQGSGLLPFPNRSREKAALS